jgi:transposase InsO family protein
MEGWRAEEVELSDALLGRDHSKDYRCSVPNVLERYVMGFQDAQALIRVALVNRHLIPACKRTLGDVENRVRSDVYGKHTHH